MHRLRSCARCYRSQLAKADGSPYGISGVLLGYVPDGRGGVGEAGIPDGSKPLSVIHFRIAVALAKGNFPPTSAITRLPASRSLSNIAAAIRSAKDGQMNADWVPSRNTFRLLLSSNHGNAYETIASDNCSATKSSEVPLLILIWRCFAKSVSTIWFPEKNPSNSLLGKIPSRRSRY